MLNKTRINYLLLFTFLLLFFSSISYAEKSPRTGVKQKRKPEKITINFVDVELSSIVKVMSEIIGKNFIYDDTLKGKVTIIAQEKLTKDEAFSLFVSALELKNFTLIPLGNSYKIIPASVVKQSGTKVFSDHAGVPSEEYIVRLIPLNYIPAQEAFSVVQPLISRNGQVSVFGSRNALLVVDTAQNVDKILGIVGTVDKSSSIGEPEVIYLKFGQAEDIAQLLRKEEQRRTGRRQEPGSPEGNSIMSDSRLNAVVLSASLSDRDKDFYKKLIVLLDVPPPAASSRINVYYLENAEAEPISKVLESLTRLGPAPAPGQPATAGAVAQPHELTGRISITPDKASNSLIILASPADYQNIVQVIQKLDRRPKQVFVEAMITEVSVDKALALGTKWRVTGTQKGNPVVIGGVGTIDVPSMQSILNGIAGLSVGGMGNFVTVPVTRPDGSVFHLTAPGFAALFSLSEFKNVINVLSTPHVLTSDNSDAEIMVGENVPFLSSLERAPTTVTQPLIQSIERKDVGIRLTIHPKISEGDFVRLDIYQEISAIEPGVTGASDLVTTKRSAKTTVVVKNNQTVVIGGLIQNKVNNNDTKVPILGDIPFIGWLFRFKTNENQKTNVIVFITPYIIEDFHGLKELKERKEKEFLKESQEKTLKGDRGGQEDK